MKYKRILIISSNPVSNIFNNGKTLAAFFDNYPKENLAQLYFSATIPDNDICSKYFKISDMDMLKTKFKRKYVCGQAVEPVVGTLQQNSDERKIQKVKKNNITRLAREVLWLKGWKTKKLFEWLDEFDPEVIFFLAGDVVYGHRICQYIVNKYNIRMAMYITDDYVLPRYDMDLAGYIRRCMIRKWMKKSIKCADVLFTISDMMKNCYKKLYGMDSFVAANMYETTAIQGEEYKEKENIVITYAGGLHYNRDMTLIKLIDAIEAINFINADSGKKITLKIYSGSKLKNKFMKKINESICCYYGGLLGPEELEKELMKSDYLLHVESFKRRNICDTKLSLSTKIPEYMSYCKPIIAVGPKEVASMQYLSDCALCITNVKNMQADLKQKLNDRVCIEKMVKMAHQKYIKNHQKANIQSEIIRIINLL